MAIQRSGAPHKLAAASALRPEVLKGLLAKRQHNKAPINFKFAKGNPTR